MIPAEGRLVDLGESETTTPVWIQYVGKIVVTICTIPYHGSGHSRRVGVFVLF